MSARHYPHFQWLHRNSLINQWPQCMHTNCSTGVQRNTYNIEGTALSTYWSKNLTLVIRYKPLYAHSLSISFEHSETSSFPYHHSQRWLRNADQLKWQS